MQDSATRRRGTGPVRRPTSFVRRSPVFTTSSGLGSSERTMELNMGKGVSTERAVRRSSSNGRETAWDGGAGAAGWDWRSRQWVDMGDGNSKARTCNAGKQVNEAKPPAKAVEMGRKAHVKRGIQTGCVSELEGVTEREPCDPRRDTVQMAARVRRRKVGIRSRRRGYPVLDIPSRRKLTRRDHHPRRTRDFRNNSSDRSQGGINDLAISTLHATNSFSLSTLEDYLKARAKAHQQRAENTASFFSTEVASPSSAPGSKYDSTYKNFEQPLRSTNMDSRRVSTAEIAKLNHGQSNQHRLSERLYGSEDAGDEETDGLPSERSGCGMSWHWSSGHHSKNDSFMDNAGGCFPVSSRRIGRKVISRSRAGKYNSEMSVSSFDSDMETVPLMTEPEPFHEYSDDVPASSVEQDSPRLEVGDGFKWKRFSRFKEDRHKLNGSGSRKLGESGGGSSYLIPSKNHSEAMYKQHRSLSQKYRPKSFKDLVGQGMVVQSLSNAISKGKIAPVYLFHGPRGSGKTSAAKIFTAAMNCVSIAELRPCGLCKECVSLANGRNFDVKEVDAAGNNEIESMRLLLKHISLPPSASQYKVFIIDDCHMLTAEAWNAFLKSLEEPPSYVVFILITTDLEKLPRTALSRCQKFLFPRIKDSDMISRLRKLAAQENIDVELEALQFIAGRADGSLRDAETMLDQLSLLGQRVTLPIVQELVGLIPDAKLAQLLELALSTDTASTVNTIREFIETGMEPLALISQLATLITDVLAGKNKTAGYQINKVRNDEQARLQQALRILSEAEKQIRSCSDRITWLTAAFLQFSPTDSCILPSSPLGTSITQSPVTFLETSEKETLDLDCPGTSQSWESEKKWSSHSPLQLEYVSVSGSKRVEGEAIRKQLDIPKHHFSGPFPDSKIHPCEHSPQAGTVVKDVKPGPSRNQSQAIPRTYSCRLTRLDDREVSNLSMDSIWRKVLESSNSNVLKQLFRGEGKLLSLSVTEGFAVAQLGFHHPDRKDMAERAKADIENAFQVALGCPIKVEISLSSLQGEDNFTCRGDAPSVLKNTEYHSRHKRITSLPKEDAKSQLIDYENGSRQDQRKIRSGSFKNSSSSFRNTESFTSNRRSIDLSNRDRDGSTRNSGNADIEGGGQMIASNYQALEGEERKRNTSKHHEVQKGKTCSGGRSPDGLVLQQYEATSGYDYLHDMKRKDERNSTDEARSTSSLHACDNINDIDKETSDSEKEANYGPSLLCWKGTQMHDHKVKHQRLRRKRRARILLRLIPCAKKGDRS